MNTRGSHAASCKIGHILDRGFRVVHVEWQERDAMMLTVTVVPVTVVAACPLPVPRHYSGTARLTTLFCAGILAVAQTSKPLNHNWQPMSLSLLIDFHEKGITYSRVIVLILFFQVITLVPSSWPFLQLINTSHGKRWRSKPPSTAVRVGFVVHPHPQKAIQRISDSKMAIRLGFWQCALLWRNGSWL